MKKLFIYLTIILLCCSCRSSRSMQKELNEMTSNLFYELTSQEYTGKVNKTVYLDFIHYSNTDYHTTIKKKGSLLVPLLFVNFEKNSFRTRLGEHSLSQLYREFLTEALLTECNSSTCFRLIDNKDKLVSADSTYRLEVKILQNETTGKVTLKETSFLWVDGSFISFPNCRYHPATTTLSIAVCLSYKGKELLKKTYNINHQQSDKSRQYENSYGANQACLDNMAKSLSLSTKEIVENMGQELHLLMSTQ